MHLLLSFPIEVCISLSNFITNLMTSIVPSTQFLRHQSMVNSSEIAIENCYPLEKELLSFFKLEKPGWNSAYFRKSQHVGILREMGLKFRPEWHKRIDRTNQSTKLRTSHRESPKTQHDLGARHSTSRSFMHIDKAQIINMASYPGP